MAILNRRERMTREPYKRTNDEMDLPDGKTCNDCLHFHRCELIYGHIGKDEVCDWYPLRFVEKTGEK